MPLAAHFTYQVAPGANVLVDDKVLKSGDVFTDEKALGIPQKNLLAMVASGHVRIVESKAKEQGHNDDTVTDTMPGVEVKAVGTGGNKDGTANGTDVAKASVSAELTSGAETPGSMPAVTSDAAAPKFTKAGLVGKDLETLNGLILAQNPKAEIATSVKQAIDILTK